MARIMHLCRGAYPGLNPQLSDSLRALIDRGCDSNLVDVTKMDSRESGKGCFSPPHHCGIVSRESFIQRPPWTPKSASSAIDLSPPVKTTLPHRRDRSVRIVADLSSNAGSTPGAGAPPSPNVPMPKTPRLPDPRQRSGLSDNSLLVARLNLGGSQVRAYVKVLGHLSRGLWE